MLNRCKCVCEHDHVDHVPVWVLARRGVMRVYTSGKSLLFPLVWCGVVWCESDCRVTAWRTKALHNWGSAKSMSTVRCWAAIVPEQGSERVRGSGGRCGKSVVKNVSWVSELWVSELWVRRCHPHCTLVCFINLTEARILCLAAFRWKSSSDSIWCYSGKCQVLTTFGVV